MIRAKDKTVNHFFPKLYILIEPILESDNYWYHYLDKIMKFTLLLKVYFYTKGIDF